MAKFWDVLKDMYFTQQTVSKPEKSSPRMATLAMEVLAENLEEAKDMVYYDALKRVTESKDENKNTLAQRTAVKKLFERKKARIKDGAVLTAVTPKTADRRAEEPVVGKQEVVSRDEVTSGGNPPLQPMYTIWKAWFNAAWNKLVASVKDFILDPEGDASYTWAGVVTSLVFYNYWIIMMRIAFTEVSNEPMYWLVYWALDLLADVIYLADIGVQFRTAYRDDHGIMKSEPKMMAMNYYCKPSFILDVLSVFPLQTLLPLLGFPRSVFYRCPRLFKWHCVLKFFLVSDLRTSKPNRLRVVKLLLYLCIAIHWVACGYYMLSEYEGLGSNTWVYPAPEGNDGRLSRKYIKSLYWSILTLTTIGETPDPCTNMEHIFTSLMFLLGIFVFAAVVGNVGDVISNMNAARTNFQTKMDYIKSYMEHHKVPEDLQNRAKQWAYYAWSRSHSLDEGDSLDMLPLRLRAELAIHVHLATLKKVKIFKDCDEGLLCELVLKLRPQIFSPKDYICRCGEIGREMYIINHGKVEVVIPDATTGEEVVVASLSEGNYFGEISLLKLDEGRNRRSADVRSVGYSELLCLSQSDLLEALKEYPDAKKVLESQGRDRLHRTKSEGNLLIHRRVEKLEVKKELEINLAREVKDIRRVVEEIKVSNEHCTLLQQEAGILKRQLIDAKMRIRELKASRPAVTSCIKCASSCASGLSPKNLATVRSQKRHLSGKICLSSPTTRRKTADRLIGSILRAAKAASEAHTAHAQTPQSSSSDCKKECIFSSEEELTSIYKQAGESGERSDTGTEENSGDTSERDSRRKKGTKRVCFTPEINVVNEVDGTLQLQPQRGYSSE